MIVTECRSLARRPQTAQGILPNNTIDNSIDFGYYIPATTNACGLTWEFWKNHTNVWVVASLMLGSQTYSKIELINSNYSAQNMPSAPSRVAATFRKPP